MESVRDFYGALGSEKQSDVRLPFDSNERVEWDYFPGSRPGLSLGELTERQEQAGFAALDQVMSNRGFEKVKGVITLEGILRNLEGRGPSDTYRDPERYYFTLFGDPATGNPLGFRLEGHHLSVNITNLPGDTILTLPMFFGANPATVPSGEHEGMRLLSGEEERARELVQSLSSKRKKRAIYSSRPPWDLLTGRQPRASLEKFEGIPASELSGKQQDLLVDVIREYASSFREDMAEDISDIFTASGLDSLYFGWAGGINPGEPHYYRIHSPAMLIEYANTQDNANHVHTVIRDIANDFGRDLLREHYKNDHTE
ncbi:MAG: DUF3500 domain-containing protein [Candidatus Marinimicrobia bacterium]|nr:DUF3500 domain-containing protein [Candidatus Neomarinimicrobiota bacterium]